MAADGASLTDEQRLVLQAVYDHFREHASWPTFITIDRPLRREHGLDTAAIFLSLPDSLTVGPRPGGLRPIANDELRLRLPGIQACAGGDVDTERFVRLLRWLAQQEVEYAPEAGDPTKMPRVTAAEVAEHLGLDQADQIGLGRLYALLQLDNWGLGGSGSGDDGWYVWIDPDIWRFRNVQTVEDCVQAREAWIAEGRAALTQARDAAAQEYFHVRLFMKSQSRDEVQLDLSREDLETRILTPYRAGRPIVINGTAVPIDDLAQISIVRTERSCVDLRRTERPGSLIGRLNDTFTTDWGFVASAGEHVTDEFISEPPGSTAMPVQAATLPLPTATYISEDIVTAIRGKAGQSKLDVAKLLALVEELNDNYARKNTYAAHALLRAILDHIPPILGCAGFQAVANNYPWTQTDKRYMRKLLDFRDQADDALHRQISVKADVLTFDDMPASVCLNRLLQECASRL